MIADREKQLSRYLHGESSEEETRELLGWVAGNDQNSAAFARACVVDELTGELIEEGRLTEVDATSFKSPVSHIAIGWRIAAVLAISLIGLTILRHFLLTSSEFAIVAQSVGARLPDGSAIEIDRKVGREIFEIGEGLVRLDFSHGASMTVEGPARFELRDAMHVFFDEGIATFQVPESAKGFTVDTADAEVIDLGTAFGLSRREGETTDVCVFEGEVKVEGKLIRAGEAISARQGAGIESSAFETTIYENAWPVTSGVLQTTGRMRFVSPGPGLVPGKFEDNEHFTVFLERRYARTSEPVQVDLTDPGEFRRIRRNDGPEIPAGVEVRSYLIQLDPVGLLEKYDGDKPRVQGQITFDQPILALIASGRKLLQSDAMLGHENGDYGSLPRGLEAPKSDTDEAVSEGKDILILAADQRTLILNFAAASAVDQLRVLVASKP